MPKKHVIGDEIADWLRRNKPLVEERTSKNARSRAQNGIRGERHVEFIANPVPGIQKKKQKQAERKRPEDSYWETPWTQQRRRREDGWTRLRDASD